MRASDHPFVTGPRVSLIGVGDATPMAGRDLSDPGMRRPGRALMQYDGNFAWMQGDDVVVLQPQKPPQQYRYDVASKRLQAARLQPELAQVAHAQALWGSLAYEKGWYRLDHGLRPRAIAGNTPSRNTHACSSAADTCNNTVANNR